MKTKTKGEMRIMSKEKWELSKWWIWGVAMVCIAGVIGLASMPLQKRVEREVLIQSHQYKEGMAERGAILEASISEIDIRLLDTNLEKQTQKELNSQKLILKAQLKAVRR